MYSYYASVMAAIESNPVTVLSAETGAGKTTQLPQFILAHAEKARLRDPRRPPVKVIVTQPRRIAAISVAQRVAQEREKCWGEIRRLVIKPKADPEKGHVVFCTSGILLRRMQDDPTLGGVTHIILDEVHERDLNTDLLLIITRQLLQSRPDLKLILMSATAETGLFAEYFKGFGGDRTTNFFPPVVNVPGRLFPVTDSSSKISSTLLNVFLRNELGGPVASSPFRSDDLPFDLFEAIIAYITTSMPPGAILVFLPGWLEINTLQSRLKDEDNFRVGFANPGIAKVYPLHSSVPTAGQQEVFDRPPEGVRKIILSTNIAETSVTINDIVYVIDSGKIRINSYDSDSRISSLSSVWASQSNIKQRSGRAGRCQPGQYYSLLSRRRRQGLPYSMPPELLRVDLQSTALKIKALNIGNTVGSVLSQAPQPPSRFNVDRAVEELTALGALHEDETLTPLGNVLSDMPVDPWIGKMVLQGAVYGCLDPILTVSGAMEIGRGIYSIHPDDKQRARRHILLNFAKGTESDQLTMLVAYRQWKAAGSSRDFSSNNFLHGTSLLNIDRAKNQLLRVLEDGGFLQRRRVAASYSKGDWSSDELMGGPDANKFAQDMGLVRAILCGSLFPNIAEVMGKDEYRSLNDPKLRLTGGSVNSWRGLVICSGVEEPNPPVPEHPAVVGKPVHQKGRQTPVDGRGRQTPIDTSDVLDSVSDDESGQQTDFVGAPLPTRLLSYQDKQRVDGLVYLRSTTRADPLALLLLSPGQMARNGAASLNWTRLDGRPAAILGGWLRIQVGDEQRARIIEDVRNWLAKYLDWIVWNRALRKERRGGGVEVKSDEEIGKELISVVAGLIGSENKE
ncbi:P-loop containing nucleoside triphosphate hydrolase protein [Chytridium lagenaria]|nr:P-loop containing nucleoside triphosphate hydrolase protein [Chytridium lagenaria]